MKDITFGNNARQKLAKGVQTLADAVSVTMGPSGKNVLLQQKYKSILTKDGVSVANHIQLKDTVENIGASMIKEAANNAATESGDGTTTATVLANAIFQEGLKYVTAGSNPTLLKKGMDKCTADILENLKSLSREIEDIKDLENVATISANGDNEIGKMIAEAINKVGKDGVITVEEAKGLKDTLDVVNGMQFDRGYLSPYFITDTSKQIAKLDDALILILNEKLINLADILKAMEYSQKKNKSLLIICDDIEEDALNTLVINKMRKILNVCVVKSPGFSDNGKELLKDIAVITNGDVIDRSGDNPLHDVELQLGTAERIEVSRDKCTIISGNGIKTEIDKRVSDIKELLKDETEEYFINSYKQRIAKLTGGIAVIKVSALTETETKERRDRIDDALGATRAAQDEGIIPGGGCALIKATITNNTLEGDEKLGANIILKAIEAPITHIVQNAGYNAGVVIEVVKGYDDSSIGFNASTGKYINMFDEGIVDALKVTRISLTNAVSAASMLLTTECVVSFEDDEK